MFAIHTVMTLSMMVSADPSTNDQPVVPAIQYEWVPTPAPKAGPVEKALLQIAESAQSSQSIRPAQSNQPAKADLSLPLDPSSINLNSQANETNNAPPLVVPPIGIPPTPPVPLIPEPDPQPNKHPEVATMKGIQLAMSAVMGAALLAGSAIAAEPKDDLTKAVEKLDAAVEKLKDIEKGLNTYKNANVGAINQIRDDVESLRNRIQQLENDVKLLKPNPTTTSKRETVTDGPAMGQVRLSNEFVEDVTVLLNGRSYQLLPGQARTVRIPAGTFTYQVLNVQAFPQQRTISPNEEKPIRIYTQ